MQIANAHTGVVRIHIGALGNGRECLVTKDLLLAADAPLFLCTTSLAGHLETLSLHPCHAFTPGPVRAGINRVAAANCLATQKAHGALGSRVRGVAVELVPLARQYCASVQARPVKEHNRTRHSALSTPARAYLDRKCVRHRPASRFQGGGRCACVQAPRSLSMPQPE